MAGAFCVPSGRVHPRPGTTAHLADGQRIVIRQVVAQDRPLIEAGFSALSLHARHLRFRGGKARLSDAELDSLTDAEHPDDVTLGALTVEPGPDGQPRPVGIARFLRLEPGGDVAELALTVLDAFQGKRAGSLLLVALARQASGYGIGEFIAFVEANNLPMRALARKFGARETVGAAGEIAYHFALSDIGKIRTSP